MHSHIQSSDNIKLLYIAMCFNKSKHHLTLYNFVTEYFWDITRYSFIYNKTKIWAKFQKKNEPIKKIPVGKSEEKKWLN